jgi:endonuclease/exonuclease/phosphatase family metal-dependent hydrolase
MAAPLTLLTVNLWNGRARPQALSDVLERHAPDMVLAQELDPAQAAVLERHYSHGRLRPSRDTHGMGIALKRPGVVRELPMPRRDFMSAELSPADWPELAAPLQVLCAHLSCPNAPARFPERREQVRRLEGHMPERPGGRVLAGDLNATARMPAYLRLRERMRDAAQEAAHARGELPANTWGPGARAPRIMRIDHVLVHALQVHALRAVHVAGSDHDGLLATLGG